LAAVLGDSVAVDVSRVGPNPPSNRVAKIPFIN
jgi:hypothetical protein